jgi:multiple sugar transport system permease protein
MAQRVLRGQEAVSRSSPLLRRLVLPSQYVVLLAIGLAMLFPLFWMLASSLKSAQELQASPPIWWPDAPSLSAFRTVFEVVPFARTFLNSFVIAGGTSLGIVLTSLMAGFVFAKHRFPGRRLLFSLVLATMFLPPIVMLVPLFRMIQALGLVDTYAGVMLPNLANAFGIFLMRQFIAGVPEEILESARIDGASEWTILWRVVTPLMGPAVAALVVFAFVFHWNSFLWPLTVLQSEPMHTVVLALNRLVSYTSAIRFQNVVMAGAAISILPNVVLFLFLQRWFIAGISQTGVKG